MAHPQSCHDPENCNLSYVEHLRGFAVSAAAEPTRRPETAASIIREARWHRDHDAYTRLAYGGNEPPTLDGARARERYAKTAEDIETGIVKIDYDDPT